MSDSAAVTDKQTTEYDKLLEMRDVHKSFGHVNVLQGINFHVNKCEIVALVGDNGAGKSTLIKTITGVHRPNKGEIYFKGKRITIHSVAQSRALGIETVYQERALADQQSMWRNMFAGREITNKLGIINVKKEKLETERLLRDSMGFTSKAITVDSQVMFLSGGEKQGVAIGRALYFDAELIILDEPTMGLSLSETKKVLDFTRSIKDHGKSAIFISHNFYHIYPAADRFVILDRGKIAGDVRKSEITQDDLVQKMENLARTGVFE